MPRSIVVCLALFLIFFALGIKTAQAQDDLRDHRQCAECGMDRKAYGFSRMLVIFDSGQEIGVCSLHCAALTLDSHKGESVKALLVADRNSHELTPAATAIWVIGGKKRGVMTEKAKWAFTEKEGAQSFIAAYGGEIISWEEALAAARSETLTKKE